MGTIKASVVGASGYTGGELIRLLMNHPDAELVSAVSKSQQGIPLSDVFPDLIGETELSFTDRSDDNTELIFLCLQHGVAKTYLQEHPELLSKKIIDLSRDFRSAKHNQFNSAEFVYGLPELNKNKIADAKFIANPGCFATAIQLGLLPLAKNNLLTGDVHVTAITGSTGAGIKQSGTTHFSWRQNNVSVYNAFEHPHNEEILESISQLQPGFEGEFLFVPQRGSFTRGIFATTLVRVGSSEEELKKLYESFYADAPFTKLMEQEIDLKMVVNTNKCFIHLQKRGKHLLITSAIDNLLKGAAGQAIQNMNIMFGKKEKTGLTLKASVF